MELKQYLKEKGMTQVAFADLVCVSKFHLNKLIHKEKYPSFKLLKRIEKTTGGLVSFKDFSEKSNENN